MIPMYSNQNLRQIGQGVKLRHPNRDYNLIDLIEPTELDMYLEW